MIDARKAHGRRSSASDLIRAWLCDIVLEVEAIVEREGATVLAVHRVERGDLGGRDDAGVALDGLASGRDIGARRVGRARRTCRTTRGERGGQGKLVLVVVSGGAGMCGEAWVVWARSKEGDSEDYARPAALRKICSGSQGRYHRDI